MKISNEQAIRANAIEAIAPAHAHLPKSETTSTAALPGSNPAAKVEISDQAKALAAARSEAASYLPAVKAAPETRTALVASLKAQVQSGSYNISSTDIADQIVRRAQADTIK